MPALPALRRLTPREPRAPWGAAAADVSPSARATSQVRQLPLFTGVAPVETAIAHIHALSRPARTFTGDFYFIHRYEDRIWFAHGDVAGKGLPAAIVMAMIQEELEHRISACASTRCDPAATMRRLDAFLRPLLGGNRFATVVIGTLRDDGVLTLANAGHCPPLIVRRDGSIQQVGSTGPLAGLHPQPQWSSETLQLAPHETLLLYSDGLTEARTTEGRELGVDGLSRLLGGTPRGAGPLAESIVGRVEGEGFLFEDDLTVLVLQRA